ncbi:replication-relaxation family protein [Streptomyces sp. NPDC087844]|uniref:replication-relaxation family protein n=1 Tax=Streptomyces sp. NPDC087844 TaxID=3365805 RepID=UPI00380595AE
MSRPDGEIDAGERLRSKSYWFLFCSPFVNGTQVGFYEIDNGTMSRAKLAREVWDYERYAGHRVGEGARGTMGGTFPFWSRYR